LQHTGNASNVIVKRGERVSFGQMIAEPDGMTSCAMHSPVSGSVCSIAPYAHQNGNNIMTIEIESDGQDEPVAFYDMSTTWKEAAPQELLLKIQECGLVEAKENGLPVHAKLSPSAQKHIDLLCISALSDDPMVTNTERLLLERTEDFLTGVLIVKKILGSAKMLIALLYNNTEAYQKLTALLADGKFKDIQLALVSAKYPQTNEKVLYKSITNKETSLYGIHFAETGCIILSVSTILGIFDAICTGRPHYQNVITVDGPCIESPKNVLVRLGTPVRFVLDYCKCNFEKTKKIILGGPLTGATQTTADVPIIKTTTAVFAFDTIVEGIQCKNCINCGHCISVCPMHLVPCTLMKYINSNNTEEAVLWGVNNCIECGCCSYVCPSKINLVHFMKLGKYKANESFAALALKE